MSVEIALAQATECIDGLLATIEVAYQTDAPEHEIDYLFRKLERAYLERDALRRQFAGDDLSPHLSIVSTLECHAATLEEAIGELREAFEELGEKLIALVEAWLTEDRPTWTYAPGRIRREHFMLAQPATRKPMYPGYMRAKGKG